MKQTILAITKFEIEQHELLRVLEKNGISDLEFIRVESMEEAEHLFFDRDILLVIGDNSLPGIREILVEMKQDEIFSHVPVILLIPRRTRQTIQQALQEGFDVCIAEEELSLLLPYQAIPLIKNHVCSDSSREKVSVLQEKSIHDFILMDLIKDYIPRTILDIARNCAHEQKISIPEEETTLTIVFGDIRGFSPRTQHMEPKNVIRYLNRAFDTVSRLVYTYNGDIDKYIGDAFLAVFSEPLDALQAMMAVQQEMREQNRGAEPEDIIQFRIGIHTGPVIRGNVGGNNRFDNTLIGDTVNTAARLEQMGTPGGILISETTRQLLNLALPEEFSRRERMKGRAGIETVWDVFEYLDTREASPEPAAL